MADFLPDDIIQNILARLSAKPLLRCRCVSRYWYRLLTEPNFMKLRSRRAIILPQLETCLHIDVDDYTPNSIVLDHRPYPLESLRRIKRRKIVIGTFNGMVLLSYNSDSLMLYNPFTGAYKRLPHAPGICSNGYGFGFGYGADPNDLKIVRFRQINHICDVYSFKDSSWSSWSTLKYNIRYVKFTNHDVGTFLNGFLYWITHDNTMLTVLDVKDMILSERNLPGKRGPTNRVLGTLDGCLCLLKHNNSFTRSEMWVMKENGLWSIRCSFNLILEGTLKTYDFYPVSILDGGRILMVICTSGQLVIYDTSNDSYITLDISLREYYLLLNGLEYVESLLSPSDMCSSLRLRRKRQKV